MAPREVRQPEVVRLLGLLLAVLLVVPVARTAGDLALGAAFLVEFLSAGTWRPLSALTAPPRREPLSVPGAAVDRWVGPAFAHTPLILVHGYSPEGKDDPRVQQAAALLARAGFDVAVPTIPGLTRGRLRPEDADYTRRMMARVEGMPLAALEHGVPWTWETFGEFLDALEGRIGLNAGFIAGHSALRRKARPAT